MGRSGRAWAHAGRRLRRSTAVAGARAAYGVSRLGGHHGTALPGYVAQRIDPEILAGLRERLDPVILVAGANGKTTTTRLTATVLERATGRRPVSNRSGANLSQGLITAVIATPRHGSERVPAVFEVDEMALSRVADALRPDVIVMLNLLRDQLDRYGEIDTIAARWGEDIARLPAETELVVCADDPRLEALAAASGRRVHRFGLVPPADDAAGPQAASGGARPDAGPCPNCGEKVQIVTGDMRWLGPWRCPNCGRERTAPDLAVRIDCVDESGWLVLDLAGPALGVPPDVELAPIRVRLTGAGGAYDSAAAVLAAIAVGVEPLAARAAVDGAMPAFGRLEEIGVDGRRVVLTLAKNPASVAEAVEAARVRHPDGLLIGLADRHADGRDPSWIWDAPLDSLADLAPITLTGSRAHDLALRFKYRTQGTPPGSDDPASHPSAADGAVVVEEEFDQALDSALARTRPGGTLVVLGTYTALLGIRRVLERRGVASAFPR